MPKWESFDLQIDGRLVRVATGEKTQTVNICTSENDPGRYEVTYVLDDRSQYLFPKNVGACSSLDSLIRVVLSRGGVRR